MGFQEDPQVPHFGQPNTGVKLEPGMVFPIEPTINDSIWKTKLLRDGWTVFTADRS
jgi:methionyl aminopeptidase